MSGWNDTAGSTGGDERFTGGPDDNPAFLDPDRAESLGYVGADDTPTFDAEIAPLPELENDLLPMDSNGPSQGYKTRHSEIARLHALGYTNNQIARHLGYSAPGISLALQKPFVQSEIARWRARYFSQETVDVIKDSARDAAVRIGKLVRDPNTKDALAFQAGSWLVEKATGKAKQEIAVEHNFSYYMDVLKDMRASGEILDVTPKLPEVRRTEGSAQAKTADAVPNTNRWKSWIDSNL